MRKPWLFLLLSFLSLQIYAQSNVTLKYFGLTIHPFGDTYAYLQPYKLDKNAHLVANFGLFGGYERFVVQDFISVKLTQGYFTDCSAGDAHIGLKALILQRKHHQFSFSLGPMYFYRESWTRFPEYSSSGVFHLSKDGKTQSKFFWYGAEVEYDAHINNQWDISTSFTPGLPFVMSLAVGVKYWPNKNFKKAPLKF
jgi:hypothetical protein